jgi:hypothetical protein
MWNVNYKKESAFAQAHIFTFIEIPPSTEQVPSSTSFIFHHVAALQSQQ